MLLSSMETSISNRLRPAGIDTRKNNNFILGSTQHSEAIHYYLRTIRCA